MVGYVLLMIHANPQATQPAQIGLFCLITAITLVFWVVFTSDPLHAVPAAWRPQVARYADWQRTYAVWLAQARQVYRKTLSPDQLRQLDRALIPHQTIHDRGKSALAFMRKAIFRA